MYQCMWKLKDMKPLFKILTVITVLCLNTVGVSSQSVTITEDTVYVMNNALGQVTCILESNCQGISWYLSSIQAPVATAFVGFTCLNKTSGYYQTCNHQNHQYTLYFTGRTDLHRQTIRCSGEGCTPQQTVSDTVSISIIVPVPSVALEGITGQQIKVTAGQSKSITCVTGSSRPAPRILWYIGGTNVTSLSTETQVPTQGLFYTRSTLTFIPTKSQNGLQVNCKAYNTDNNMVELTRKPTLNVQYPPDDANAVIKQGNTITKTENDSVTLVCEVRGGNPLSTITLDCFGLAGTSSTGGDISRSTINFIANRSHNRRTCTCRASHPAVNLGSDSVTINVHYGPASITYQPGIMLYTRNEGENLGPIQCVSDCNPKCNSVWTRPGHSDYNGENLTISGIQRTQEGEYKCRASNSYGSVSGSKISAVVNYGPDPVTLTPSTTSYIVNETFQLGPIKCAATCKPACSYKWIRPNQNDIQGDTLTINSIQRIQTGTYKCQAYNTVGTRNSYDISVTVHYATKPTSMVINGNNFTVLEHSTKTITCFAEGLPQPTITLSYISNSSIIKSVNGLKLDFTFPLARCEDTGIYRCDTNNKFTPQQPLQKEVFVLCQPRAAKEQLQNRYALSVGKTLNITVSYIAYPRPTFHWFKNDSNGSWIQITDGQEDVQINNSVINKYTYLTRFIRQNLKEDDFGNYILISNNSVNGPKKDVYIVGAKGKPQKPRDGQAVCIDYKSAVITWKPGFFNGVNQTFSVLYKEKGGTEQISVSNISDPGQDKYINHTVNFLQGAKTYFFTIHSKNTLGNSPPLEVNCSTEDAPDSEASTGLAVGAGLGSALVIIIIVVIVVFVLRRFKGGLTKGKRDVEMNGRSALTSGDEQEDGMHDNVLYEPAGPNFVKPGTPGDATGGISDGATGGQNDYPYAEVQKNGKSGLDNPVPVYAEVQKNPKKDIKPDPSAVYTDVQKPKKEDKGAKPKKMITKGKAEKQKQGDLYENVENVNKGNFAASGPALLTKQNQTKPAKPPKAPKRNKDGLIYADLDLEEPVTKPGQKLVIRGLEDRTDYAEIDITRRGDPLPPDDKPQKEQKDSVP